MKSDCMEQLNNIYMKQRDKFYDSSIDNLINARENSLNTALKHGLPTIKDEDFKYTSFKFLETKLHCTDHTTTNLEQLKQALPTRLGNSQIVFYNGHYIEELSSLPKDDSLKISILSTLDGVSLKNTTDNSNFQTTTKNNILPFCALNNALHIDNLKIEILKNSVAELIQLVFLHNNAHSELQIIHPKLNIYVHENAKCSVIEQHSFIPGTTPYFSNANTDIYLSEGAKCDYYMLQQHAPNSFATMCTSATLKQDAQLNGFSLTQGAQTTHQTLDIKLTQAGANAHLNGLYQLNAHQNANHLLKIAHQKGETQSREYFRGILADNARGIFNGKIYVAKHADKTDADMVNKNLLLSEFAEADSRPQLEIYAKDVKCSHGSTVGKLDQQALYYLQSRGINKYSAKALLTKAFANTILESINHTELKNYIEQTVTEKFQQMLTTEEVV